MKLFNMKDMRGGWFVGNFEPTAYKTDQFEVSFKIHLKDEKWDTHYHTEVTEVNFLSRGKMTIQNKELNAGDIFILNPFEIADPIFLEDCEIVCVKTRSINDKISVIKK